MDTELSYREDFDQRVRDYILDTLTPFVSSEDRTGHMLMTLLRRMLKSASHDDLQNVIHETGKFIHGLEALGLYVNPAEVIEEANGYLDPLSGPGGPDWANEAGQIDTGEGSDRALSSGDDGASDDPGLSEQETHESEALVSAQGSDSGYETEMEGNEDSNGEVDRQSLPEDGSGG